MFKGSIVALVTPMRSDMTVDEPALADLVSWHVACGTTAIVPVGTTGESPTLSHDEHRRVVDLTVAAAAGRVPVIAGAGSNSTAEAVALARHAKAAGAAACLVVVPYYNKPTQAGLILHYEAVAAVGLPIIIYNIPSRCVIDMSVETMAHLARNPAIVGVKDSTQNLARPLHTRRACGPDFVQLSGEDATAISFCAAGGDGCISVTANVAPRLLAEMHTAWQENRTNDAIEIQDRLLPLHDALFCETNPAPVKYAMHLLGRAEPVCRLPIAPLTDAGRAAVRTAMAELGLLSG